MDAKFPVSAETAQVQRTKTDWDNLILKVSGNQLRWLVVVTVVRFASTRLSFLSSNLKAFIVDLCFLAALFLFCVILWRLVSLVEKQAEARSVQAGQQKEVESLITLLVWVLRFGVLLLATTFLLSHYAVNITAFALFLGLIVLIFSFASKEILADLISGAIILLDRPFRIGDRIELKSINSWGDVVEIGMRSTKIRSVENLMVVLPNSEIGKSEIVNYNYPDPSYFDVMDVLVGYDNDVDQVEELLAKAILSVDGILKEHEPFIILKEFTETHMLFWAGWWIPFADKRYPMRSKVSKAIIQTLKEAGVIFPHRRVRLDGNASSNLGTLTEGDEV